MCEEHYSQTTFKVTLFGREVRHPALKVLILVLTVAVFMAAIIVLPLRFFGFAGFLVLWTAILAVHCVLILLDRKGFFYYEKRAERISIKIFSADAFKKEE